MKLLLGLLVSYLVQSIACGRDLNSEESAALVARAEQIGVAFEKRDIDSILAMTHPVIYELVGGKAEFEKIARHTMSQLASMDIAIVEATFGKPSRLYTAGSRTVCFLPCIMVMKVQEKRARSTSFLVAVRDDEQSDWLFLDGSAMRDDPTLLRRFFPELPNDVQTPENRIELLKDGEPGATDNPR